MKRPTRIWILLLLVLLCQTVFAEDHLTTTQNETVAVGDGQNSTAENVAASNIKKNTQDITDAITRQADFTFVYIPNQIYKVYCQEQRITDIQLQPGEDILYVGAGDTVRWVVDQEVSGTGETLQWHVYVKPLKSGLKTNFIINTDRHVYHMEVTATAWYTPIVNWSYPQEERAELMRQKAIEEKREEDTVARFTLEDMNFEYKISSPKNYPWKPQLVFDDGSKTYIQMPSSMKSSEAPALFIKDGEELQLVNYRVKSDYYIVDRLFNEAELRIGKEVVKLKKINKRL